MGLVPCGNSFHHTPFFRTLRVFGLVAPYCAITTRLSQRYPPIARYGVFCVSTWPIGCDTPPPFSERFPIGEHAKWRCDTPPSKGVSQRYLRDTLWKQGKWVRYPPLRYYLEKVLRDMGGYLALGRYGVWKRRFMSKFPWGDTNRFSLTLTTLTSLNKESRPFSSLFFQAIRVFGSLEGRWGGGNCFQIKKGPKAALTQHDLVSL